MAIDYKVEKQQKRIRVSLTQDDHSGASVTLTVEQAHDLCELILIASGKILEENNNEQA